MINGQLISISLFTGAFGLDLGMEQAGFHTVSVVEIDPNSTKTIAINRPFLSESAIPRDICCVKAAQLLEEGGNVLNLGRALKPGEVDLITGGPPCQPFSTVGKRLSVKDPRGSLFKEFIRIVKEIQPRFFVMENVRGLLSAPIKHRPHRQRGANYPPLEPEEMPGSALKVILEEIESINYKVAYRLLQSADYGIPQTRFRVFFLASRDNIKITFPQAIYGKNGCSEHIKYSSSGYLQDKFYQQLSSSLQWRTLRDGIQNLADVDPEYTPYSAKRLKYLKLLKAGQNWKFLPDKLKPEAMGGAYNSGGGKVGFYRRLSWDKPSPTVTTSPHQKATDMCHPEELRPLSVKECARLQTFPDNWVFFGSTTSKYRQIGNAVPVILGAAIGRHIVQIIQGQEIQAKIEPKQQSFLQSNSFDNLPKQKLFFKSEYIKNTNMHQKEYLKILLKDAGAKKASLLAEKISTIDKYISITEEELRKIQWVAKDGKYISMVKDKEIDLIVTKRDLYLKNIEGIRNKKNKLIETSSWLSHIPILKALLKEIIPSRKANDLAKKIENINNIKTHSVAFSNNLNKLSSQEKEDVVNLFLQKDEWDYQSLKNISWQVPIFTKIIYLRAKLTQKDASILSDQEYQKFKFYLFKKWYRIQLEPTLLLEDIETQAFIKNDIDRNLMTIAVNLLKFDQQKLNLCLLFCNEIIKLQKDIPNVAQEAIINGNPFLFRSLFGNFQEAKNFAVGGKLNSSLETKYGNLFEKIMTTFNNCREIFDGGVDVVVAQTAFDIKSGPNVMNKSMVDAFSAKQRLIQEQQLLPDLKNYKIALGYGRRDNLNSFMAKIDSEILTAREAWTQITGVQHSPEIVFAIAGLIPQILGVKSVVSSMLTRSSQHKIDKTDEAKFQELFSNSFEPIHLTPQAKAEIETIESSLN